MAEKIFDQDSEIVQQSVGQLLQPIGVDRLGIVQEVLAQLAWHHKSARHRAD